MTKTRTDVRIIEDYLPIERISEAGTVAMVFEDLQWADAGLLDFIESLMEWSRSKPILID